MTTRAAWTFAVAALLGFQALACRAVEERHWPFPPVSAPDVVGVLRVLRARTSEVHSFYAEMTMGFTHAGSGGVFDAVLSYRAPGELRLTGFKDMLVSTRGVFDLVVRGDRYELTLEEEDGPVRSGGPLAALRDERLGLEVVALLGERLFLPGYTVEGERVRVDLAADGSAAPTVHLDERLEWTLDRSTLGVRSARVVSADGRRRYRIDYPSYSVGRAESGRARYLPERFTLVREPVSDWSLTGRLRPESIEWNPEFDDAVFALAADGAADAPEGGAEGGGP